MTTDDKSQVAASKSASKKVERSAAYPAITIDQSLKFVEEVYKNFRNDFAKRSDIIGLIENSHARHLAASRYYLFLIREEDTYQVSDFYKTVVVASSKERANLLLKSFKAPKLYAALIEKFDGDEIPKELEKHLKLFYGITADAAPLAADVFLKNAKYCGVLSDNNVLSVNKITQADFNSSDSIGLAAAIVTGIPAADVVKNDNDAPNSQPSTTVITGPLLLPEMFNEEKIKIRLTRGRFSYWTFPSDLSNIDIQILKKELEKLELIASAPQ